MWCIKNCNTATSVLASLYR